MWPDPTATAAAAVVATPLTPTQPETDLTTNGIKSSGSPAGSENGKDNGKERLGFKTIRQLRNNSYFNL